MKPTDNTTIHVIKKTIVLFITLILFCVQANKSALAGEAEEYAVKAAFAFNFIRFIQWPEASFTTDTDAYKLCFIGDTAGAKQFNTLNNKKIEKRTLYVHPLSSEKGCEDCDIVFISRNIDRSISEDIISKVKGKPILTIGESKGFAKLGGVINFISKDGRLQFEINTIAAKEQSLKPSSRLLELAVIVDSQE